MHVLRVSQRRQCVIESETVFSIFSFHFNESFKKRMYVAYWSLTYCNFNPKDPLKQASSIAFIMAFIFNQIFQGIN